MVRRPLLTHVAAWNVLVPLDLPREGREGKLSWCRGRKCLRGRARAGAKGRILCDQGVWAEQGEGQGFSPE